MSWFFGISLILTQKYTMLEFEKVCVCVLLWTQSKADREHIAESAMSLNHIAATEMLEGETPSQRHNARWCPSNKGKHMNNTLCTSAEPVTSSLKMNNVEQCQLGN